MCLLENKDYPLQQPHRGKLTAGKTVNLPFLKFTVVIGGGESERDSVAAIHNKSIRREIGKFLEFLRTCGDISRKLSRYWACTELGCVQPQTPSKTIKAMNGMIRQLFCSYRSAEAFWAAAENVLTDSYSQTMFLHVANRNNHIVRLFDDRDRIRALADSGNTYMQYAYARLHDILIPEPDSVAIFEKYYTLAMEGGIADARMQLAYAFRDGDFGETDIWRFRNYMDQALEHGSERALQHKLHQLIYGIDGVDADPERALLLIDKYLNDNDGEPDPVFYRLRGNAHGQLGMKEQAASDYAYAAENGDGDAYFHLAILTCLDENFNVKDFTRYSELMSKGQEAGSAAAYLETAVLLNTETYDALDKETAENTRTLLVEQLTLASIMGEPEAPYLLGTYFEDGMYGLGQDYSKAWQLYSRSALLRSAQGFECLSRMTLEDGTAPEGTSEEFGYEAAYRAYILGADTLETVIRGYRSGFLTHHAAVIEEYYLPRYVQQYGDEDYDAPEIEED